MKIKPKYIDPETTPLKFLKLVRVTLWMSLIFTIVEIISQIGAEHDWYMLGINLVGGVLLLAAISGLNRMEWYGVKAYCGSLLLRMLDYLLAFGLYLYYGRVEESLSTAAGLCGGGVAILLIWIYFQKRRLLFTPIPEEYLPLMEKEKELIQALTQEKEAQAAEGEQVPPPSEATVVPLTDSLSSVTEQPAKENREERLVSHFCWNCGSQLEEERDFCSVCGKEVYKPEREKETTEVIASKSKPVQKKGKKWIAPAAVLLAVALVVGVLLLSPPQLPPPTQAAENVLYLEVYDRAEECIATGSGFLVGDRTTLVTNYHVIDEAHYLLVMTQDGETAARADVVLAYDEDMDLAVLRCDREVGVQPLTLGNSETVRQGDKIYAAGYPLGIANTLSDGIVSSKYVDELGVELLQITAAISEGSSGGALLNENGQVVGVVCATYTEGQNMNLAVAVNQLNWLLGEIREEIPLAELFGTPEEEETAPPKAEKPKEEVPKEKPKEEAPKEEVPKEEPKEEAPKEETLPKEVPEEKPVQPVKPPKEETPKQPVEPPKEELQPKEEPSVEETPEPAPQTGSLSLSETTFFLAVGDSKTLTVQIEPADLQGQMTWTSSKPETVQVRDGVVTVLNTNNAGAVITATTESGLSAECKVLVMASGKVEQSSGQKKTYIRVPEVLSIGNVAVEGEEIGLWRESVDDNMGNAHYTYVYQTTSAQIAKNYVDFLEANDYYFTERSDKYHLYTLKSPDTKYKIYVQAVEKNGVYELGVYITALS